MGRVKGMKQTGLVAANRREGKARREAHKEGIAAGTVSNDLPAPLVPDLFRDLQTTYWHCLNAVPDPRAKAKIIYPLALILHRIIAGFVGGARFIGVLFPKTHRPISRQTAEAGRRLGGLPTQPAVYALLRRIDWQAAHAALAPVWDRLGYTPQFVVRRPFREPKAILAELRREQAERVAMKAAAAKAARQAAEKAQGMSAAKAKRQGQSSRPRPPIPGPTTPASEEPGAPVVPVPDPAPVGPPVGSTPVPVRQHLLMDGKVVKASYNTGCQERFVHVTAVTRDGQGERQRFILGAQPTVLDRHGEWGAAVSILDALTPLPATTPVLVSGDAGFCVEEHAEWLSVRSFGYLFRIKKNAGGIYDRVVDWAESARQRRPEGHWYEPWRISGADLHSRRLWRLPGLRSASFPGITEGFVVEKKACASSRILNSNTTSPANLPSPGQAQKSWSGSCCIGIPRPEYSG